MAEHALTLFAVTGMPLVTREGELGEMLAAALARYGPRLGDVLVVTQKVVSKSEGRIVDLDDVVPGEEATRLARQCGKPAAYVQVVLDESVAVLRCVPGVLVTRHRSGHVMANAGIDQSNVEQQGSGGRVLLLPSDPDAAAQRLRGHLHARFDCDIPVVLSDSFGRPWRTGTCGTCVGVAGLQPVHDLRGEPDLFGRPLEISMQAVADELASAASLLMGQGNEGVPAVLVRGFKARPGGRSTDLLRPVEEDLFQ